MATTPKSQASDGITRQEARDANAVVGVLTRRRARRLTAGNADHLTAVTHYVRLGRPEATAADAVRALEIIKSSVSADDLYQIATS